MRNPRKTPRIAAALAVAVGMLLAFAALGGVGLAQTAGGPGKGQYGKGKVIVCHKGKKTVRISKRSLPTHLAHGDTLGRCERAKKHRGHKDKGSKGEKGGDDRSAEEKGLKSEQKGYKSEHPGKGKRGNGEKG